MLFPRAAPLSVLWYTRRLLAGWLGLVLALGVPAHAEDPPRRVGSLNYISGEVNYALRAEGIDPGVLSWSTADFNQPVCQDMSLQTGPLARARIRIGSNAIQMAGDTLLDVLNLDDRQIEASLRQGRVHLQLRNLGAGESVEIEIPRGSLWVLQSDPGGHRSTGADNRFRGQSAFRRRSRRRADRSGRRNPGDRGVSGDSDNPARRVGDELGADKS